RSCRRLALPAGNDVRIDAALLYCGRRWPGFRRSASEALDWLSENMGLRLQRLLRIVRYSIGGIAMLRQTKVAVSFVLVAFLLMMEGTPDATAGSKLPDPIKAGVAEKLFRLDCGRSLANDESVWTPGENAGRSIEFSSTCSLIQ